MIDHPQYYRLGHHHKRYHQFENYLMKYKDKIETCLTYRNHENFQDLVHCGIECEERALV